MTATRIVSLLLFSVFFGYAVLLTAQDRSNAFAMAVADRLQHAQTVTIDEVAAAAAHIAAPSFSHSCRSDILQPGLTVMLVELGRANRAADYAGWVRANTATKAYISAMIRCTPSDGNAWLRDVLVDRGIAEDPESILEKMTIAQALMPYEEGQVAARLHFWKQLSPLALKTSESLARSDIRAALLHGTKDLQTSMRDKMSPAFEALVNSEAATDKANRS